MEAEKPPGGQVTAWLQAAQSHVQRCLQEDGGTGGTPDLSDDVIKCIQTLCAQLPLSYSFTSISQLLSLQRTPCVSLLGWDTGRFQAWSQEALQEKKLSQPPAPLSRARLLIVGYIASSPAKDSQVHDGNLYLRDSSGFIPCEMSQFDPNLLGTPVLFPCWSYIPIQNGGGYVEVLSPPVPVTTPVVRQEVQDPARDTANDPERAFQLLHEKSHPRGFRVSVKGQLTSFTSLINIRGKTVFFFFLQDSKKSVPIIVQVPSVLYWYHILHTGDTYEVTSLAVSSLRGSDRQIFAVTSSSCLIPCSPVSPSCSPNFATQNSEELTTPPSGGGEPDSRPQKAEERQQKESKTLDYQGVVTRVRDAQAGLYELDGMVVLCTAYTQLHNAGRGLREGSKVEVMDAHLQQSPSPLFPTIVLSCCLRSRVRVSEFSRLNAPCSAHSTSGNLYLHLLFRYRLRLPEYLWVCDVLEKLHRKLLPHYARQRCLARVTSSAQGIAQKLLHSSLSSMSLGRGDRDLQEEMVADPHDCPLRRYCPLPPVWTLPPLSDLSSLVCASQYLRSQESSQCLHWSHYSVRSQELSPPHVLLGVLHASSSGSLQLKDESSSLVCLILPRPPIAWIGCVLEVRQYQLVAETLQRKDKEEEEPRNRTYAIFLAQDVTVLHSPKNCSLCSVPGPARGVQPSPCKVARLETAWAQRHLLIESVEGRLAKPGQGKGLQFQAKASWVHLPDSSCGKQDGERARPVKNGDQPPTKVLLLFTASSVRWFPFLHANRCYRVIATEETDSGIFDSLSESPVDMPSGPRCLKIPGNWILEDTESEESADCAESCSIEKAVKGSPAGSLVSVIGVVSSRSMCNTQSMCTLPFHTRPPDSFLPPGVSIKVILTEATGQSAAAVYLELYLGPYPLGLLPGATVFIRGLEKRVARSGSIYLRSVPTTYISIRSPPIDSSDSLPPPLVLFKQLSGFPTPLRAMCFVSYVLSLTLSWDCAMCSSTFTKCESRRWIGGGPVTPPGRCGVSDAGCAPEPLGGAAETSAIERHTGCAESGSE
ncbi:CST complex subunit CTC1 isoform X2 [Hyperolius riggenbachi]|uniref:CST complex subunit CTC1 isoform X2 n=1 Tax=Hyperolius riggenbachi TaxID=752182 RepID=UPI0035A37309